MYSLRHSQSNKFKQIVLKKLQIQYSCICPPVKVDYSLIADNSYHFEILSPDDQKTVLTGQCALVSTTNGSVHSSQRNCIIIINFDADTLKKALKKRYGHTAIPWIPIIRNNDTHKTLLHSLLLWLIDYFESVSGKTTEKIEHIENALIELFIDNLDRRKHLRLQDVENQKEWFTELEKWMDENLGNPVTLNDLARVAGVSARTIQKAFKVHRQCTPTTALLQKRLAKARQMLQNPVQETSVLDVALQLELHPSRFAKQYKEEFGESPSETLAKFKVQIK